MSHNYPTLSQRVLSTVVDQVVILAFMLVIAAALDAVERVLRLRLTAEKGNAEDGCDKELHALAAFFTSEAIRAMTSSA